MAKMACPEISGADVVEEVEEDDDEESAGDITASPTPPYVRFTPLIPMILTIVRPGNPISGLTNWNDEGETVKSSGTNEQVPPLAKLKSE